MVDKILTDEHFTTGFAVLTPVSTARKQRMAVLCCRGFTLVELIMVIAVLGVLASIAIPSFTEYKKSARNARCATELRTIDKAIAAFVIEKNYLPSLLSELNMGTLLDPWQRPYEYQNLNIAVNPTATPLEDIATNVLNTDYDLYSKGEDGAGTPAAGDPGNDDDIVRSDDGIFAGMRK